MGARQIHNAEFGYRVYFVRYGKEGVREGEEGDKGGKEKQKLPLQKRGKEREREYKLEEAGDLLDLVVVGNGQCLSLEGTGYPDQQIITNISFFVTLNLFLLAAGRLCIRHDC